MLAPWHNATIVSIEDITDNTRIFRAQLPDADNFSFRAGQFMTFDLPIHEKRNKRWRSYSIASAPDTGNILEFVIVASEQGMGTRYLFEDVKVGTAISMRGPQGIFTLPDPLPTDKILCFVCTGTGIAPFRSILHDLRNSHQAHPPIHLIFGTRYEHQILYGNDMQQLTRDLDLHYHVALSRETPPNFTGHRGYVHSIYEQLFAAHPPASFYLCGWRNMVTEAQQRLLQMGYDRRDIHLESYD